MEHFLVKKESMVEDAMEIGSDFGSQDFGSLDGVENLQVELDMRKGMGDASMMDTGGTSTFTVVPSSSSSVQSNQIRLVSLANNLQAGDQHVKVQNNQIVMSSGAMQPALKTLSSTDAQKPMVTKLIISKNAGAGQQQVLSVGPHGLQTVGTNSVHRSLIGQPNVATSLHNMASLSTNSSSQSLVGQTHIATSLQYTSSPTKTYTMSQSGVLSPQKFQTTPSKYTVQAGRMSLSPTKTPTKMMTIPMSSLHKSPQKIVQMPGGQQYVMLTRPTSGNARSPSKVIIKGHGTNSAPAPRYAGSQAQSVVRQAGSSISLSNVPSNVQPVPVTGSKFQYVRLVTTPASQAQTSQVSRPPTIAPAPQRALAPVSAASAPIKLTMPINSSQNIQVIQQKQTSQSQRLILPATSGIRPASQSSSNTLLSSNINSGQTISLQGLQGLQGFALIPAQYISQGQSHTTQSIQAKQDQYHQVQHTAPKHTSNAVSNGSLPTELMSQRPRKPCNCTKSQCLKLYCDCFANGEFCSNCNCNNCFNNLDHEEERQRAIKTCLERNPHAFHPKIGKGKGRGVGDRRHNKGCNCKRSGCLKNYCECYEAKIMCSNLCKCVGCKNFEESPDRKTLMHLADAAEVRHQQQTAVKTKLSSQIQDLPSRTQSHTPGERLPYSFVTAEVAEATCACLVAQAEEAERTRQQEMMEERMILEEFGRCLMQVIQSSTRTKAPSPVP